MADKLIEELIIKIKQQGAKPTEKALRTIEAALDDTRISSNNFNQAINESSKKLTRLESLALKTAGSLKGVKLGLDSSSAVASLDNIEDGIGALINESIDLNTTMGSMNKNLIVLFDNLASSLGGDLDNIRDGLTDVEKQAGKTSAAVEGVGKASKKAGRGTANQNRQGRNQARTFADIYKAAGPLPLLYANIAANVFALSEAFRLISEGEQLNRLEEVGTLIGAKIGTPVQLIARDIQELTGYTVSYGDSMRQAAAAAAYGFDSEQIEQMTMAARRASIALGVDMQDALNRVLRGTSKLEIELLDELGITTKLTTAYEKYAVQLGVSADSLNAYQQRAALVNEINEQSVAKLGMLDAKLKDGAPWEAFGANVATSFQVLFKNIADATKWIPDFFNKIEEESRRVRAPLEDTLALVDSFTTAKSSGDRAGILGIFVTAQKDIEAYKARLLELQSIDLGPLSTKARVDIKEEMSILRQSIARIEDLSSKITLGKPQALEADEAYRNLAATIRGTVTSFAATKAAVLGKAESFEKLYSEAKSIQEAYELADNTDPLFNASKALDELGFSSKAALDSVVELSRGYREASRDLHMMSQLEAESKLAARKSGSDMGIRSASLISTELKYTRDLIAAKKALGASETALAKENAKAAKLELSLIDARIKATDELFNRRAKSIEMANMGSSEVSVQKALIANERLRLANLKKTEGSWDAQLDTMDNISKMEVKLANMESTRAAKNIENARAGEPEILIQKALLENQREYLANLSNMPGAYKEREKALDNISRLEREIAASQLEVSNSMMESALSDLSSFAPGVNQMTGSMNQLAMSFNNLGESSMTSTQMVSAGLQAFQGYLQYASANSISAIDDQIAAERKRDGKSKESVAKIAELERKKTKEQQKAAKKQILISTAVAVMNAAANPWPLPAIPLMATAALAGGLAYRQASQPKSNSIAGMGSTTGNVNIGSRENKVNVGKSATQGELAYSRGESGIGSIQSFTPRANGGIGTPGNSIVVGEHGTEVITPLEPVQVTSAEESLSGKSSVKHDNRQLVVQALDTQSIMDRSDEIFDAWDNAAYERGYRKENLY